MLHLSVLGGQVSGLQRVGRPPDGQRHRAGIVGRRQAVKRRGEPSQAVPAGAKSALEGEGHRQVQEVLAGQQAPPRRGRLPGARRDGANFKQVRAALALFQFHVLGLKNNTRCTPFQAHTHTHTIQSSNRKHRKWYKQTSQLVRVLRRRSCAKAHLEQRHDAASGHEGGLVGLVQPQLF